MIAWDNNSQQLIFIEVKQRAKTSFGLPVQAVNRAKLHRIMIAAEHYRHQHHLTAEYRFDIVTLRGQVNNSNQPSYQPKIEHFVNVSYDLT